MKKRPDQETVEAVVETVTLAPGELLRDSRRQGTSMSLPLVIHHRLNVLTELASALTASRADIVGALIANAPIDADAIERLVLDYKKMTVGEAMPDEPDADLEVETQDASLVIPLRKPGRPPRKAAG